SPARNPAKHRAVWAPRIPPKHHGFPRGLLVREREQVEARVLVTHRAKRIGGTWPRRRESRLGCSLAGAPPLSRFVYPVVRRRASGSGGMPRRSATPVAIRTASSGDYRARRTSSASTHHGGGHGERRARAAQDGSGQAGPQPSTPCTAACSARSGILPSA